MSIRILRLKVRFRKDGAQIMYQAASPRGTYYTVGGALVLKPADGSTLDKVKFQAELDKVMPSRE